MAIVLTLLHQRLPNQPFYPVSPTCLWNKVRWTVKSRRQTWSDRIGSLNPSIARPGLLEAQSKTISRLQKRNAFFTLCHEQCNRNSVGVRAGERGGCITYNRLNSSIRLEDFSPSCVVAWLVEEGVLERGLNVNRGGTCTFNTWPSTFKQMQAEEP